MMKTQRILKDISSIFPWSLVILGIFPWSIGCLIDSSLINPRDLLTCLVWIPVFTIPNQFFKSRGISVATNSLYFLVGTISLAHWLILKGPISVTSILVISNTNYQEALEFYDLKATMGLLLLIPYFVLFLFSLLQRSVYVQRPLKSVVILIVAIPVLIFITENTMNGRLIRKGMPSSARVGMTFYQKFNLYKQSSEKKEPRSVEAALSAIDESQTFVLILGESCNRNHMSLYGYGKQTTPLLDNREDILVFDNVVSPYSNTLSSVLTIFSESNLENGIEITQGIDLIDIFHSAGFKTYWISNQSPIGIWDNLVTVMANKSDLTRFVNFSSNSSFEATYTISYDDKVLAPFAEALDEKESRKFIVVHLMGNHSKYSKRYPSDFEQFKGADSKDKVIASYDNSIAYNDFILDSLFNILGGKSAKRNNSLASAVYLSDHGENVYDEFENVGHDYSGVLPKANVEIPFLLWRSEMFEQEFTEMNTSMESIEHRPYVSDDLFHSVMDLNGIRSPYLQPTKSLFSKEFDSNRQRILEDNKDYDLK